ncbi:MAG: hypothetical protein FGM18_02645 [Burkholderiaceae bacterium]|nr:hypothetical protein [Burkholderiaceae bacterium]
MQDHNHWELELQEGRGGLRAEIAAAAASLIAEDGLDYASAKRKAFERISGGRGSRIAKSLLPSNDEIEDALRDYQQIFQSDTQPARLKVLRQKALDLMRLLKDFSPMLAGAVANGTAGQHSDIHLHCFADSAKDLGIFLLNQRLDAQAATLPATRPGGPDIEALAIQWQGELATIAVYPEVYRRNALRQDARGRPLRLDIRGLEHLLTDLKESVTRP